MAVREYLIAYYRLHQPCQLTCLLVLQLMSSLSTARKCLLFCLLCFKGLAVFRDFIAPTPAGDHPQLWVYIGVLRLFGAIEVWKLVGLIYKINTNKVIQKTEFLRIYCVACRVLKYLNVLTLSLTATLHLNIFYLLSFIFYLLSISLM